ncbi:hypothetical protein BDA99DRAFT_521702 [Phascolomyces articulosus]|uniref:F-box domain-containing protein n=1 Tax=Phascolomyces articulosus TaxID=60185 RepID=A0AAD5JRP0_9FUNG|nr:hypothetical protein BDA99DRAFT_521702 [Phascolomyces articulosus]
MPKRTATTIIKENAKRIKSQDNTHSANGNFDYNSNDSCQMNFERGHDAFTNARFPEALRLCDTVMEDIVERHLKVLDLRAATLGMMAEFKKAEQDASLMIQLAPSQGIGYARMGDLWTLRGNQKQAILAYERGLALMKNEEDLELLTQRREEAIQKSNERFDIIANLPYDIMTIIFQMLIPVGRFNYLDSNDRFTLLEVSKTWQDIVSTYAPLWKTHKFSDADGRTIENMQMLSQHICKHVTEISSECVYSGFTDCMESKTLFEQLSKGGFTKLQRLHIYDDYVKCTPRFIHALSCIAKTLKSLELIIGNLPTEELKKILDTCTELRSFMIQYCEPDTLNLIQHQYKNLRRLCITWNTLFFDKFKDEDTFKEDETEGTSPAPIGLRDIAMDILNPEEYISLFKRNQNSIETLFLETESNEDEEGELGNREGWILLRDVCKFPNLRSLNICPDDFSCTTFVAPLIQNAPHIQSLSLNPKHLYIPDLSFITAIANIPCLKKLEILSEENETTHPAVDDIFRALASKGKKNESTLQEIRFFKVTDDLNNTIDSIADIPTLQHITLEGDDLTRSPGKKAIVHLCSRLQSHPGIQSISLIQIDDVDDETLAHLAMIQGLQSLYLELLRRKITRKGLSAFDGSSTKVITNALYAI